MRTWVTVLTLLISVSLLLSRTRGQGCNGVIPTALSNADPHIQTFDGYKYDVQLPGEFLFCNASGDLSGFILQVQHSLYSGNTYINTGVAFLFEYQFEVHQFEVVRDTETNTFIFLENGIEVQLISGQSRDVGNPAVFSVQYFEDSLQYQRVIINTVTGLRLSIEIINSVYLNLNLLPEPTQNTVGLCGSYNCGNDDESLLQNPGEWQVLPEDSIFTPITSPAPAPAQAPLRKKREYVDIPPQRRTDSTACCLRYFPHLSNHPKELEFCVVDVYAGNEDFNCTSPGLFLETGRYGPDCHEYLGLHCDVNYICDRRSNPAEPRCVCAPGFSGPTCSDSSHICSGCTGAHHLCINTVCTCAPGYTGYNCDVSLPPFHFPSRSSLPKKKKHSKQD